MELTKSELFIARKLFQLEIYKRNGQDFENFFVQIMQYFNPEFVPIKPQGQFGDRKNDGFIKSEGKYYQVYSPENPKESETKAITKLVTDFDGLHKHWNTQVTPIKEFYFVLNDKYSGTYPTLHPELQKIETNYQGVIAKPFFAHHLEKIFFELDGDKIENVLNGPIISAEEITGFDVSVMNGVIKHLIKSTPNRRTETFPTNPNFPEKIVFNSLSQDVADILKFGSYQEGALIDYFKINDTFYKDELKYIFQNLYQEGVSKIPDSETKNDLIFFYILENAHTQKSQAIQNALYVLMAYFFSYCDIFEEPKPRELFQ